MIFWVCILNSDMLINSDDNGSLILWKIENNYNLFHIISKNINDDYIKVVLNLENNHIVFPYNDLIFQFFFLLYN